jgi:hypothetical protein
MAQHSQWLQGFRQHVSSVASLLKSNSSSSVGAATGASHQLQSLAGGVGPAQQSVVGGPLSPVASSSLLTPRLSAQPMTLDLGSQQLVISLVHKTA